MASEMQANILEAGTKKELVDHVATLAWTYRALGVDHVHVATHHHAGVVEEHTESRPTANRCYDLGESGDYDHSVVTVTVDIDMWLAVLDLLGRVGALNMIEQEMNGE